MKNIIVAILCLFFVGCITLPDEPTDGPNSLPTNEEELVNIMVKNLLDEVVEVWVYQGSDFNDELYHFYVNPGSGYKIKLQKEGVYKVCILRVFGTEVDAKCVLKKTIIDEEWTIQKNRK
jgi:hypothetical protein